MAFANNYQCSGAALVVCISTATLVWFGNGLDPWWPLLWFAPLPVLWFALRSARWSTAAIAFIAWFAGSLNLSRYFHVLGMPLVASLSIFMGEALLFVAAVMLFRALVLRAAWWSALFAFPAVWVACEYLRSLLWVHGTAANLAYSQLNFLPFLQLASIAGPWGMSFLLLLFPAAIAIGIHLHRERPNEAIHIVSAAFSAIALVLIFGAVRLAKPLGPTVRVGLVASDQAANIADPGADTQRLLQRYSVMAKQLAAQGAQAIVLPEKLGVVLDSDTQSTDFMFQSSADHASETTVVGQLHVSAPVKYNRARVYAPDSTAQNYDKEHMLPPFESNLRPGTSLLVLPRQAQTWGVAICKDMDFTSPSRQYGKARVGLMLVPAWDFNVDRSWHGHIAVMRGVEDGFSLARAARNGFLTVSDDRGRIVAETRSDSAPFATLIADVPATHDDTLYLTFGDWFAWFTLGLLAFSIIQRLRLAPVDLPQPSP
jgi:apolipoprotein N-acyltransferase